MTNTAGSLRALTTVAICVLVAVVVGYSLAEPMSSRTILLAALVMGVLSVPILLRWHHPFLIVAWNAWLVVPFLPGNMELWILMSFVSLGFSVLHRTLEWQDEWIIVRSVALPLIVLGIVTLITMWSTGGFGSRVLGQEHWGARKYLSIYGAVFGFFALTARSVPIGQARILVLLFFASAISAVGATIVYALGPSFYFLFTLFPAELAALQVDLGPRTVVRYSGLAWGARAVCFAMLAHYGIRGLSDAHRPWRGGIFLAAFLVGLFGGFRSYILLLLFVLAAQFWFERLHLTRYLIHLFLAIALVSVVLIGFVDHLPIPIQRGLSFLPLEIHPEAKRDAMGTLEWRLLMWKYVVPEVPKYLWVGKGFAFSGVDYVLTQEAISRHIIYSSYEAAMVSGAYHHGILTLIIPLGLAGMLSFLWFAAASLRVLYLNYKHGDLTLRKANTFLLAYFSARLVFYLTLYGQFELDLPIFVGMVGLSIAINGGVRRTSRPEPELEPESESELIGPSTAAAPSQGTA